MSVEMQRTNRCFSRLNERLNVAFETLKWKSTRLNSLKYKENIKEKTTEGLVC